MADSLLVAVAGGAVGSVLTILARYGAVPAEVRQHDQETTDMDRDLNRFAADESARLMGVIFEIRFPNQEPPGCRRLNWPHCGRLKWPHLCPTYG